MMKNLLLVGCGSFVGGVLRYLLTMACSGITMLTYSMGTAIVNIVGCFAFGLIYGLLERFGVLQGSWGLLLMVGLCGGFTTFSSFSNEMLTMLNGGNFLAFLGYAALSLLGGLAALYLARHLALL